MQQKIVYIDGYWLDTNETFENYKCIIGEWDGISEDDDIFFYFEDEADIKHYQQVKGRTDTEFVITKLRND